MILKRNSANLGLLIDKTSSIYLYVKLKSLASWIFLSLIRFEETPTHISIKINRVEERQKSYPLVCRRPTETVPLQRRHICYRWGTPAYWSHFPYKLGFPLFLIPNQKADIISFLKKVIPSISTHVHVFNEMCIAASNRVEYSEKERE